MSDIRPLVDRFFRRPIAHVIVRSPQKMGRGENLHRLRTLGLAVATCMTLSSCAQIPVIMGAELVMDVGQKIFVSGDKTAENTIPMYHGEFKEKGQGYDHMADIGISCDTDLEFDKGFVLKCQPTKDFFEGRDELVSQLATLATDKPCQIDVNGEILTEKMDVSSLSRQWDFEKNQVTIETDFGSDNEYKTQTYKFEDLPESAKIKLEELRLKKDKANELKNNPPKKNQGYN